MSINLLLLSRIILTMPIFDFAAKQVIFIPNLNFKDFSRIKTLVVTPNFKPQNHIKNTLHFGVSSKTLNFKDPPQIGPKEVSETLHAAFQRVKCSKVRSARRISRPRHRRSPGQKLKTTMYTSYDASCSFRFIHFCCVELDQNWIDFSFNIYNLLQRYPFIGLIDVKKKKRQRQRQSKTWQNGGKKTSNLKHSQHISDCCHPREQPDSWKQHGLSHLASSNVVQLSSPTV